MFEIAFENKFYELFFSTRHIFVTPMSQLNHGMFDFVYICKEFGSYPTLIVERCVTKIN